MFVNKRTIRIEWGDCDPAGIVFFPRYFAYFDACTMSLFEAAGLKKQDLFAHYDFGGFPMVDVQAKFYIPSRFGDDVVFESAVTRGGKSSFDVHHKVHRPEGLALEGFEKRVWTGKGLKSTPTPEDIVSRFLTPEERAA